MAEGVRYVRERQNILALFGLTAITTIFVFPNVAVLMPFYAKHVLHVGPTGLGWIMAVSGVGALLGATCLLVLPRSCSHRVDHDRTRRGYPHALRARMVSPPAPVCSSGGDRSRSASPVRSG